MNFLLQITVLLVALSTQTLVCAQREKSAEQIGRSPAMQGVPALPKRGGIIERHAHAIAKLSPRNGQTSPRKDRLRISQSDAELKNDEIAEGEEYRVTKDGKHKDKIFIIAGSCLNFWEVTSVKNAAQKNPRLFEQPSLVDYCNNLQLQVDSAHDALAKVLTSNEPKLNEPFYLGIQTRQFGSVEFTCLHPSWLKKAIKEVKE